MLSGARQVHPNRQEMARCCPQSGPSQGNGFLLEKTHSLLRRAVARAQGNRPPSLEAMPLRCKDPRFCQSERRPVAAPWLRKAKLEDCQQLGMRKRRAVMPKP